MNVSPRIASAAERARHEHGQMLVLGALAMTALCGMAALAVDLGMILQERRSLQNATDAATLAAAAFLPNDEASAVNAAVEYSMLNGYALSPSDVVITSTDGQNDTVEIVNDTTVDLYFARVLGFLQASPETSASAQVGAVGGVGGVVPFGIEQQEFVAGESYCLKLGTGSCGSPHQGNFHALDIDDVGNSSSNIYRDKIRDGSNNKIRIGDVKDINTGNMAGPTRFGLGCQGNDGRLTGNDQDFEDVFSLSDGVYTVLDWESPRIGIVPIVEYDHHTAEVVGFAIFYLDDCVGNDAVSGRYVPVTLPGGEWTPLSETNDFGLRALRLKS